LVSSTDGEGKTKAFSYLPFGLVGTGVTAEGIQTRYQYDGNGNKTREEIYSASGTLSARTDYSYDTLDHVLSKNVWTGVSDYGTVTYGYDGNGNLTSEKTGNAAEIRYAYDELGHVKEKRVVMNPGDSSQDLVTAYQYDRNGNVMSVTDPNGHATAYQYDLFDRKTRATDPTGAYVTYTYDRGSDVAETHARTAGGTLAQKTVAEYDALGRALRTTRYDLAGTGNLVSLSYHSPDGTISGTVDPAGNVTRYAYDSFGRLSSVTDALGNAASKEYDKRGLVTREASSGSGGITVATQYAYDNDGRVTAKKAETGTGTFDTSYVLDALGNPLSVTDADGNVTAYGYDLRGKRTSETRYLSGGTVPVTVSYAYDDRGNLVSVTDASGRLTAYSYDAGNRNTRVTYPDGSHKGYSYDKNGNVVTETRADGSAATTAYDALNRPVSRTASGVALGTSSEAFAYDALGRLASASSSGTAAALSGNVPEYSALSFSYDSFGRMASETQNGKTVSYGYDANGNNVSASASGYLAAWTRDALGRMASASLDGATMLTRSYSGNFLASSAFANGVGTSYGYDALGRLSGISTPSLSAALSRAYSYSPAGNVLGDGLRTYSYDPLSRLVGASALSGVTVPAASESFAYSATDDRTDSALDGLSASYSGNVLDQYVSVAKSGTSTGTDSYSFDLNGNLVSDGTFLYAYDFKNRLASVRKADGSFVTGYSYDPLGRRSEKRTSAGVTDYLYADDNAVTETFAQAGSGTVRETSYLYGDSPDELVGYSYDDTTLADTDWAENSFCNLRVAPYSGDFAAYGWTSLVSRCGTLASGYDGSVRKTFSVHADALGSTLAITDGSGSVALQLGYSAFGEPYAKTASGTFVPLSQYSGNLHGLSRLFTGREYDAETGLYHYRARTYSATLGRFLQRDPV
jgi:RHS repeat-associated protein